MIVVIDNYDSFTWNLVHALGAAMAHGGGAPVVGQGIIVVRHDAVTVEEVETMNGGGPPAGIVISPGPCGPHEAGVSGAVVQRFAGRVPILGVCLGHQVIAAEFGMRVGVYAGPVHGKTSVVTHDGRGVFAGVKSPMEAARYHSLVVERGSVPAGWTVSAWTEDGAVMGLRREWDNSMSAMLEGVQFHPESFMTAEGPGVVRNFVNTCTKKSP